VIINREASKKHWKELSRINQSAGNGVAIAPPSGAFDEDPEDNYEHGGKIDFNPNHVPSKMIVNYAKMIKSKRPEIWKLGGNIFGNEAFENLLRVSNRGYWLDSEEWMYIKWRAYVARHAKDFRIEGVVAMLKWCDKVDKGWAYMKQLIEEKIEKLDAKKGWKHKTSKMKGGGRTISQTPAPLKDKIKGSKFNEKGSASTSSKASDIKFDDNTIKSIQRLIDEHNDKHPSKKITLSVAKAVVRRGMGAYSSSHRPTISGGKPNSRTAWGLARLKAFIYKAQTGKSKSGNYSQDNDLFEELGISVQKMANGGEVDGLKPAIPTIIKESQFLRDEMIETIKQKRLDKGEEFTEFDREFLEIVLLSDLMKAIGNYLKPTDKIKDVKTNKDRTGITISTIIYRDGEGFPFYTDVIVAGGHNIQIAHYRYLVKTKIRKESNNPEYDKYKEKIKKLSKIERLNQDMRYLLQVKERYESEHQDFLRKQKLTNEEALKELIAEEKTKDGESYTEKTMNISWDEIVKRGADKNYDYSKEKFLKSTKEYLDGKVSSYKKRNESSLSNLKRIEKDIEKKQKQIDEATGNVKMADGGLTPTKQNQEFKNSALFFGGFFTGIQKQGIGKSIIYNIFKTNPNLENILLYTQEDAIGFWEKVGGEIIKKGNDKNGIYRYFVKINRNSVPKFKDLKELKVSYKNLTTKKAEISKGEYVIKYGKDKIGFFFVDDLGTIKVDPKEIILNNNNIPNVSYKNGGVVEKGASESYNILMQHLDEYCQYHFNEHLDEDSFMIKTIKNGDGHKVQEVLGTTKSGRDVRISIDQLYMKNGGLIAPNGKPSNLTPKQYKLVRTPQFKAWFGDWENDPANSSKIVDENGEPMVVYHGTNQKFTVFSLDKVGSNVDYGMWGSGFYFSPIKSFSKGYGSTLLKIFLNIKNPFVRNPNITGTKTQFKPVYGKEESLQLRNEILSANYDGVIQYESGKKNLLTQIIAFEPTQIKLADGTNTTFDGNNPDIRYKDGGSVDSNVELVSVDYLDSIRTQDKSPWNYDLEKSIEEKGVEEPVVIGFWAEYGYVALLDGHHRLDTAIELGIDKIPAIVIDKYDVPHGKVKLYRTPMYKENPKKPSDLGIYKDGGSVDAKDTVTLDIPLLIRTLELAREDIKSDAELHEMVERLLDLKNKPELTMDDYAYIADIEHKHLKPKMELGGNIEIEKLIAKAHDNLTRKRGRKEYAPTSHELQEEIDRMIMEDQFGSNNI
jgi:hypothetical protein